MSSAFTYLKGNLTSDPEMRFTAGGQAMLTFAVATERSWQSNGEWQKETSFFDVIAWRTTAEDAASLLSKGMTVLLTGYPKQDSWQDKETGAKRSKVVFVADDIALATRGLESVVRKQRTSDDTEQQSRAKAPARRVPAADEPFLSLHRGHGSYRDIHMEAGF